MVRDELFDDAVQIVLETKRGSVSLLQRRLSVGYARASRMIEMMAASGILGEYKGSQAREVTMTPEQWQRMRERMQREDEADYEASAAEESSQPAAYIKEGQQGYVAVEEDD